ncbi:MAG: cysteine--tRNA ligase [bacterium]
MINLFNSLTKQKEEFVPIIDGQVGLYTCGPTVYNYAHIGNLRTFVFEDLLKRVLQYNGYEVKHIMNITDVGHLTGDMDMGEDKLEQGAKKEGKTAKDISDFYTKAFQNDLQALNILAPNNWCKATDYIKEQVIMIKMLEEKGYTYKTSDGIYFDTSKVQDYNKLSHLKLDELQEGARVEKNNEKKNPTDFAVWKFSKAGESRQQEWESPWGIGFPGWHLECSAMSLKMLGEQLDIHCGGIDLINVHHTNEIAQSEAVTGKKFFNYWMHGAFLNIVGGKKMAKSEDNFLTLENAFVKKNINPLAYRFACLQTHYRKPMEYSEEAMQNAESGLDHLSNQVRELGGSVGTVNQEYQEKFKAIVNDDLNLPQAMAIVQEVIKSNLSKEDKLATILDFDMVLGLKLDKINNQEIPEEIQKLVAERQIARDNKDWDKADEIRKQVDELGYLVEDSAEGQRVVKK